MLEQNYILRDGSEIPKLGLGTWQMSEEEAYRASKCALEAGYRQIDTAAAYGNERGVGRAIKECGVPRGKLFITTKIPAEYKSAEEAERSVINSLDKLDCGYIDLLLIHAPLPWDEICYRKPRPDHRYERQNIEVWRVMESFVKGGRVRSIGVSNFENEDVLNILRSAEIAPVVNQVRCHIGSTPRGCIDFSAANGILVQAYSPNATGRILKDERVAGVASRYGVSVPQLAIRYCLQLGVQPLPKTTNPAHIAENARLDFEIDREDMLLLEAMGTVEKVREK